MYSQIHTVTVTTDADGDGSGRTPPIRGRILEIVYAKTDYDNGVEFAITTATTSRGVWSEAAVNASTSRQPRAACHGTDGAALHYNDESDEPVVDAIAGGGEEVSIVVASGGNAKSGTFYVIEG